MKILTEKCFLRNYFILLLPIALQNIIAYGSGLADNLMLGGYSESSLSAVAIVNQIQYLLQMIVLGIGEGLVIVAVRYWGRKEIRPIKEVFNIALRLALLTACLIFIVTFLFPQNIMSLFTNNKIIIHEGILYIHVVCFSYFFFCLSNVILAVLRSVEVVKIGFYISLFSITIDVSLKYVLIYGKFGVPEMGVVGAALTTVLGQGIELFLLILYLIFKEDRLKIRLRDVFIANKERKHEYFSVTPPVIIGNSIWGIASAVQTIILGKLGTSAIAANSIATTVFQIITVFIYAGASASNVVVGKTLGEKGDIISVVKKLQIIYLGMGIMTGLLILLSKFFILDFYKISQETKELASYFMIILSLTSIGTAYQMSCSTGILRGGGDTKFVLRVDLLFMWGVVIPFSFMAASSPSVSPIFVFVLLKCDQILKCVVYFVRVNKYKWINAFEIQEKGSYIN